MNIVTESEYIIDKDVFAGGLRPSMMEKTDIEVFKRDFSNFVSPSKQLNLFGEMPLAQNQMQRGTCATFAISRAAEYVHKCELSEQYIYNLAYHNSGSTDPNEEGTTLEVVCEQLKNHGACLEEEWPYYGLRIPSNIPQDPIPENAQKAAKIKITSYRSVAINSSRKAIEICNLLYNLQKPIVLVVPVFWNVAGWETGDFIETPAAGTSVSGLHAIVIFGYDIDLNFLIFQNSWGLDWGMLGMACISFDYIDKYLLEVFILDK